MKKFTRFPVGVWKRSSGQLFPIFDVEKELFFELDEKYKFFKKLDKINKKPLISVKNVKNKNFFIDAS